jgi:excisionase family DNA binding protein
VCVVPDNVRIGISMQATIAAVTVNRGTPTALAVCVGREWLTASEAALRIGVSAETIYDACASGGLRHVRLNGRRSIRIKGEWLDEWMTQFVVENR